MARKENMPDGNLRSDSDGIRSSQRGAYQGHTNDIEMGNTTTLQPAPSQSFNTSLHYRETQSRETPLLSQSDRAELENSARSRTYDNKNTGRSSEKLHSYNHNTVSGVHEKEAFSTSRRHSQNSDSHSLQQMPTPEARVSEVSDELSEGGHAADIKNTELATQSQHHHRAVEAGPPRSEKRRGMMMDHSPFQVVKNQLPKRTKSPGMSASRTPSFQQSSQVPVQCSREKIPREALKRKAEGERTHADLANDAIYLHNIDGNPPALVHYYDTLPISYANTPSNTDEPLPFNATQPSNTADVDAAFFSTPYNPRSQSYRLPREPVPKRTPFTSIFLPPPNFMYRRTNDPNFNIFANGILLFPDLCFVLANTLPPSTLLTLYSISRPFHTTCNTRFSTMIKSQAQRLCPGAAAVFPVRSYETLCRADPAPRIPHPNAAKRAAGVVRPVPGFKWLFMIVQRVKIVQEIFALMAEAGTPLPIGCRKTLYKIWYLMDLPDNVRRVAVIHSRRLWSEEDLYWATFFFIKLDMRLNHPEMRHNTGSIARELLLTQREGLTMLWKALKGRECRNEYEVLKLWVKTFHVPISAEELRVPAFDIPASQLGRTQWEFWGQRVPINPKTGKTMRPVKLSRPDDLVRAELVRRGVRLGLRVYLKIIVWGYVDPITRKDVIGREFRGRKVPRPEWADMYEEDDRVSGAEVGDDELLDLGDKLEDVSTGVKREKRSESDVQRDREEEQYLKGLMRASLEDQGTATE